tara:strand:- start:36 stop:1085 length:1050 start_codon:yes stop_codon:yes gene_type:complete
MIIKDISVFPVSYNMLNQLTTSGLTHKNRDSWIIKITDIDDYIGYGEASPLLHLNDETFESSGYSLEGFKLACSGIEDDIDLEEIMILIKAHTFNNPSASFAIETAIYDILSQRIDLPLSKYLNKNALSKIIVNGIYGLTDLHNYKTIKVKCGFRNLYDEIQLLDELSNRFKGVDFIIDLNEAYDLPKAIRFFKEVEKFNIKYIEQPICRTNLDDLIELRFHSSIPIALDESINGIESLNNALDINCGDVFVIKPQLFGSFSNIKKAIQLINSAKKIPVITSSLEGIVGRLSTMHLCSSSIIQQACGVALEPIYNEEINSMPLINNDLGVYQIPQKIGLGIDFSIGGVY